MDVDTPAKTPSKKEDEPVIADEPINKPEEEKKEENPDATFEILKNPSRVLIPQQKYIIFEPENRYNPVKEKKSGFLILND